MTLEDVFDGLASIVIDWVWHPVLHWMVVLNGEYGWETLHVWDAVAMPILVVLCVAWIIR